MNYYQFFLTFINYKIIPKNDIKDYIIFIESMERYG